MSNQQASDLSDLLAESHAATQKLLETIDLDLQIYTDPVWRARDVIWHIAVWDRQVTRSIEAYQFGGKYSIPDFDEHEFNAAALKEGREISIEQVMKGSNQARQEFSVNDAVTVDGLWHRGVNPDDRRSAGCRAALSMGR